MQDIASCVSSGLRETNGGNWDLEKNSHSRTGSTYLSRQFASQKWFPQSIIDALISVNLQQTPS